MFNVEHSIYINSPAQAVYDTFALPEGRAKWAGGESTWETPGPPGAGSRLRSVTKLLGRPLEVSSTVLEWEPPYRFVTLTEGSAQATMTHIFEERDGGTQVRISGDVDLSGLFKVAEPLLKRQIDKRMEADLDAIKLILELEAA